MAGLKTVAGSGYGSVYIDALIAGGPIWDMSTGAIKFRFGQPNDKQEARAIHGDSAGYYENGTFFTYLDGSLGGSAFNWGKAYTWAKDPWIDESQPLIEAINQFERVCGIRFADSDSVTDADMVAWKTWVPQSGIWSDTETPQYADPATQTGHKQSWLYLDTLKGDDDEEGSWNNSHPGGFGFSTILHMLGLAVGLAQADNGGSAPDATTFPGVQDKYDIGPEGLNQAPFTVMSSNFNLKGYEQLQGQWGAMKTLGAFDIAALQALYGVNTTTATGNDVYVLPTANVRSGGWWNVSAPGWSCIWDAGGTDTISGRASKIGVVIDLRAATLIDHDPYAGGYISQQRGIAGGFTIANKVVIENAIGGSGSDVLIGNAIANRLTGNSGNDTLAGGAGNDVLSGGAGADKFVFNTALSKSRNVDKITDYSVANDTIYLDNAIFRKLTKAGTLSKSYFTIGARAQDSKDFIGYNNKTGDLWYDPNGSGAGGQTVFAKLKAGLAMGAAEFKVI